MIRLFASDLDGTLFNKYHKCDDKIENAIREIVEHDRFFTVATGRGINMVDLNGASSIAYYICLNGSVIVDPNRKLLHSEPIDKDILNEIIETFGTAHLEYVAWNKVYSMFDKNEILDYRRKVWKEIADDSWLDNFLNNITKNFEYSQSKENILKQDICKINYHFEDGEANAELDYFLKKYSNRLVNAPSGKGMYEITKCGVDKASGIQWLANYLRIPKDEIAVYGDGGNDITMLEMYEHSYAPSTACDMVKEKAQQVIGPYNEYSVIEHMLKTIKTSE